MITHFTGKKGTNEEAQKQKLLNDKKLDNLDQETIDKIKEQLGDRSSLKERLEEIKGLSKAERAELFRDLKNDNLEEQKVINKELQDRLDKQDKRNIQLAQQLQEAKNKKDPAQIAVLTKTIKDNDKKMHTTRLEIKKASEETKKQAKEIEDYFKMVEQNKP